MASDLIRLGPTCQSALLPLPAYLSHIFSAFHSFSSHFSFSKPTRCRLDVQVSSQRQYRSLLLYTSSRSPFPPSVPSLPRFPNVSCAIASMSFFYSARPRLGEWFQIGICPQSLGVISICRPSSVIESIASVLPCNYMAGKCQLGSYWRQ